MSILSRWVCEKCGCDDISDLVLNCPKCSTSRFDQQERRAAPRPTLAKPLFVGLAGPAQVGKSTTMANVPTHLLRLGITMEQRSFAGPLYEMLAILTRRSIAELKRTKDTPWTAETAPYPSLVGWSPRRLLQLVGEFLRKSISPSIWVEHATAPSDKDVVVFDDARHGPEFDVSDGVVELRRTGAEYACDHPSAMPPPPEVVDKLVDLDYLPPVEAGLAVARFIQELHRERATASEQGVAADQDGPAG